MAEPGRAQFPVGYDEDVRQPVEAAAAAAAAAIEENGGPHYLPQQPEEEPLPAVMGQDDPRRMKLTREEREWAMDIKDCIEMMPDLDNLTDFMYAQLAIICEDNMEDAIQRAYGLQEFREEYNVQESFEQGRHLFQTLLVLFPKQFLSFSFSEADGVYVLVHDLTKQDSSRLTTLKKVNNWFASAFYVHTVVNPDLESVRKGFICCVECEGYDWRMKQDAKLLQKMFSQLLTCYPFRGICKHYHTGMVINLVASACRKILPAHLGSSFQVGLQFEGRLDEAFLVPTPEIANQRFLRRVEETLQRRYENERTFSLTKACQ